MAGTRLYTVQVKEAQGWEQTALAYRAKNIKHEQKIKLYQTQL